VAESSEYVLVVLSGKSISINTVNNGFLLDYYAEKKFEKFKRYLIDIIIHWKEYQKFIVNNQNRDFFMEVEEERQLFVRHLYELCEFISTTLNIKWNIKSLSSYYENDYKSFKEGSHTMHEGTLDKILTEIKPYFSNGLISCIELIVNAQKDYWQQEDLLLFEMCKGLEFNINQIRVVLEKDILDD